jgi:ATP-dependent Clp protease adaptor protein ClpS
VAVGYQCSDQIDWVVRPAPERTARKLGDIARMVPMPDSDGESLTPAGGTAIAERPVDETLAQTPWVTIVWDDPVNLMSYVTHVFVTYFHYAKSKAEKLMLQVHTTGKAIVSSGSREAMERDVTAMHEYGLWATLDKSDK